MCGIAGFYGFRDDNLIKKFSEQLLHRGPDGEGYFINDQISLLNRRLAIIDRKGGDQPIFNEDKSIVVTYNGEIYNYQELRWSLESCGHIFRTKSDTEIIVHGYEEWGEGCFDRFNGMFGVALYDVKKQKLVLARDHFGIKPMYFALINSKLLPAGRQGKAQNSKLQLKIQNIENLKLVFSSEIKPIIYSGMIKRIPNDRIIYRYLRYRIHDDQRETFFEGVYRLLPGEIITVQGSTLNQSKFGPGLSRTDLRSGTGAKFEIRKFTSLENDLLQIVEARHASPLQEENLEMFKKKLTEAIRLRLISEVPVGTCLSGGIDSSTVVAVVNKLLSEKVKEAESVGKIQNTFSAVFPGGKNDEEKYVDVMCRGDFKNRPYKINNFKIHPKPEEFFAEIEEFVKTQEEPTISTGPYAQYKVMQEAHKRVTVVLDGQGADEMIAGYTPYYFVYLRQLWKEKKFVIFAKEFIQSIDLIIDTSIKRLIEVLGFKEIIDVRRVINRKFYESFRGENFSLEGGNLKKRLVSDIFSNSLQALLRYEDKNAMRFSIEGRVPFLDFNLIRYLFSLSDEAIIKNGWNKYILRKSIKNIVPDQIRLRRNKIGFTTPEYQWFMRMKNKIYSVFLSESFAKRRYFNQKEVLSAFQNFIEGKNDDTMVFWRLLNLELWLRVFFDQKSEKVHGVVKSIKSEIGPNEGKKLEIKVEGKMYARFPIRTELFKKGDAVVNKIAHFVTDSVTKISPPIFAEATMGKQDKNILYPSKSRRTSGRSGDLRKNFVTSSSKEHKWWIVVSEKIVAIAQGRSYFIWDIKPSLPAKILANFVTKTPYGIGLGSPWTMELALREVGVMRIVCAAIVSAITKPFGIKGLFYRIAGEEAASIDGPTEYSLYPSNVSAKLGPKEPQKAAKVIHQVINSKLKAQNSKLQLKTQNFLGVIIIDANDLGQKVLGNSTGIENKLIEKIFSDNPMGQADEQTPLVIVFKK